MEMGRGRVKKEGKRMKEGGGREEDEEEKG